MAQIDVVDEAIIDADPASTYDALLNEFRGSTDWWMPHWEARPRGHIPVGQVGAVVEIIARGSGTSMFTAKITQVIESQLTRGFADSWRTKMACSFTDAGRTAVDPSHPLSHAVLRTLRTLRSPSGSLRTLRGHAILTWNDQNRCGFWKCQSRHRPRSAGGEPGAPDWRRGYKATRRLCTKYSPKNWVDVRPTRP
jgi:hypothetical protein